MNRDNWLQHLQTPAGSKRPSPSPSNEDREVKKSRMQPYEIDQDSNLLDSEMPFSLGNNPSSPLQGLHHNYGSQFDKFANGDELPDLSHLESPSTAEPWFMNLPHELPPIDSFLPFSAQLDISMGNSIHGSLATSRPFEETLPFIDSNGLWEFGGDHSQAHANTPDILSAVEVSQNGQPVFSEPQANQPFSQISAESPPTEFMDVCHDYDTCFGVVIAELTSSSVLENGIHPVAVNLKPFGGILILQNQNSGAHVGILNNYRLVNALRQLRLKMDATVISEIEDMRESGKLKMKKSAPPKTAQKCSIRITLYGLLNDKLVIGDLLSDAGFFLQHPYAAEIIPEVQYDNPHYLLRPGAEMPKLEHLHLDNVDDSPTQTEPGNEISKSRFLQIFETAEADGGTVTAVKTSPSPRLRSPLMSHQITALAMMLEKESGYVEQPMFPSLWRKELSENGKTIYYRHTVTRSLEPKPIPAMGGILADDMGLGKTLSMLALICSSLDFDSTIIGHSKNTKHRGTLIVAPKSTIYGWVDQISQHIHEGQIRVGVYHGPNRESLANKFRETDVVITTYETLRSEWASPASEGARPLYSWKWLRVVLDEGKQSLVHSRTFIFPTDFTAAHHIRNRSKQAFQSVCELTSCYRWCLTGTPIHNSLDDYGALLSFVRVFPFVQKPNFMSWIVRPVEEKHILGVERLQGLIRATCLRRTKQKTLTGDKRELPRRSEEIHEVHLHEDDQVLYDTFRRMSAEIAAGLGKRPGESYSPKGKDKNILLLINCLRLICDHGEQLLPEAAKKTMEESSVASFASEMQQVYHSRCSVCEGEIDDCVAGAEGQDSICVNCATSEQGSSNTNLRADLPDRKSLSASQSAGSERSGS
ncbi:SNF2 family N-terminal domain-containing protein, partial [Leptodontidium sp. MPI-SDFR-AT-0119]